MCFALLIVPGLARGQTSDPVLNSRAADKQIRKLRFEGNDYFSDKELTEAISFSSNRWLGQKLLGKEAVWFSRDAYQMNVRELQHFYQSEGFLNVEIGEPQIRLKRKGRKIELTFRLTENEAIHIDSLRFVGPSTTINEDLQVRLQGSRKFLEALPGSRFRDALVWNDQETLTMNLINKGHAYAASSPHVKLDTIQHKASIDWELEPGPLCYFGDISIEGQERTPEHLIRKQLALEKGQVYSRAALNRSQQQIYQLGTFRIASLRAQLSRDQKDSIPVRISLTEAPRTSTRVGLGYGREDKFRTFVDFRILNFPGGARRLNLYAKHSALEPYRFEARLTQPAVFSPNSTLELAPSVKKQKEAGYELFAYGSTLGLLQRLSNQLNVSLSLYYENVNLDTTSVARTIDVTEVLKNYSKGGLAGGLLFDSSQPRFDPARGWVVGLNAKSNSQLLPGKYSFFKYQLEVKHYQQIAEPLILAMRARYGGIRPGQSRGPIPVEERFFAGGSRSVRGWARQQLGPIDDEGVPLGGNTLIEVSLEPRLRLFGPLSMVVFADVGNVWPQLGDFSAQDLRFSAGGGLRFSTPIGPVGIDLARPVADSDSKWQLHFNIGHAF